MRIVALGCECGGRLFCCEMMRSFGEHDTVRFAHKDVTRRASNDKVSGTSCVNREKVWRDWKTTDSTPFL